MYGRCVTVFVSPTVTRDELRASIAELPDRGVEETDLDAIDEIQPGIDADIG